MSREIVLLSNLRQKAITRIKTDYSATTARSMSQFKSVVKTSLLRI